MESADFQTGTYTIRCPGAYLGLQTQIVIHFSSDGLQLAICKSWHLLVSIIIWVSCFKSSNQPTFLVLFLWRSLTDTRLATGTVQEDETLFPRMFSLLATSLLLLLNIFRIWKCFIATVVIDRGKSCQKCGRNWLQVEDHEYSRRYPDIQCLKNNESGIVSYDNSLGNYCRKPQVPI